MSLRTPQRFGHKQSGAVRICLEGSTSAFAAMVSLWRPHCVSHVHLHAVAVATLQNSTSAPTLLHCYCSVPGKRSHTAGMRATRFRGAHSRDLLKKPS